ncbi:MAG: mercury methylation corrinoid protein HgcA [Thermodesulfobacteriota bacterium]
MNEVFSREKKQEENREFLNSSSGLKIMISPDNSENSPQAFDPLDNNNFKKPGYKICSCVKDFIDTKTGYVPVVKTSLDKFDLLQTFFVRCGFKRHKYEVSPGLYAAGNPGPESEVLVTANFKLTFDHLRKNLEGLDLWILVLDTNGVNVWCAAGKKTFSTEEIVKKVKTSELENVVNHRRLILPQLGAIGVSAFDVLKKSGFKVIYGPVRAKDIKAFLENSMQADEKMRRVTFNMYERFILTPVELYTGLKPALIAAVFLFLISGAGPGIFSFENLTERGPVCIAAFITGIFSGAVATPVLLPYLPGKAFGLKGIISGFLFYFLIFFLTGASKFSFSANTGLLLLTASVSSYFAMNFTGSTPYTSPSGVEKEMKLYIPVQITGVIISTGLWVYSAF